MAAHTLLQAFRGALPAGVRSSASDLGRQLEEMVARAQAAFPQVAVPPKAFVAFVAERLPGDSSPLDLATDDLYLACGCIHKDKAAIGLFCEQYISRVRGFVAHLRLPPTEIDELEQLLMSDLLVGDGIHPPKLASYSGRGELFGWLRVTAVRAGLRLLPGKADPQAEEEKLTEIATGGADPELEYLKAADRAAFKAAFREALGSLPVEEQNVLRQHYIDGLSIDQLGVLHQAHRTSTARWLRQARESLFRRTQKLLMKRTGATRSQCESIVRQAQSRMDITLRSLLR